MQFHGGICKGICAGVLYVFSKVERSEKVCKTAIIGQMVRWYDLLLSSGLRQAPEVVKLSNCADEVGTQMIRHDNP